MVNILGSKKLVCMFVVSLMVLGSFALYSDTTDAAGPNNVLFDMGNGKTVWASSIHSGGDTLQSVIGKTASSKGLDFGFEAGSITVNGKTSETIGTGSGTGSFIQSGTTSKTVESKWRLYAWELDKWTETDVSNLANPYVPGNHAIGFYPAGAVPIETPTHRDSWTMVRGNAENTGNQTTETAATEAASVKWHDSRGGISGVYSSMLYAQGLLFVKFGTSSGMGSELVDAALKCYSAETGEEKWSFEFPGILYYETSTPVILGDSIYVTSGLGYIFKLPWREGPGTNNVNVTTFDGSPYDREKVKNKDGAIPYETGAAVTGFMYSTGCGSLVVDSGAIFCKSSNGMVYCFNPDLGLIWSYQMAGYAYFLPPTVCDSYVFSGALNGFLYVLNKTDGTLVKSEKIYARDTYGKEFGSVGCVSVIKAGSDYSLLFGVTDGKGMSSAVGGIAVYSFNGSALRKILLDIESFGMTPNFLVTAEQETFRGAYFISSKGMFRIDTKGGFLQLNGDLEDIHAGPVLVNDENIYAATYTSGKPNYVLDTDGKIKATMLPPKEVSNYNMSPPVIIGDWVFFGNDSGMYAVNGEFPEYFEPVSEETSPLMKLVYALIFVIILLAVIYAVLRFGFKKKKPFTYLRESMREFVRGAQHSHNTKNRHRLLIMLIVGAVALVAVFMLCLSVGSTASYSVDEMFSLLSSAISKGGKNLTNDEIVVYSSRLPRTMAAVAVGIGLSVAGSMYQAIIRNPLVDPYIMGVSAGAGTAAIGVIAFNFTFFGLFSPHSLYLVAFTAMIGGLAAFFATMLIAEKAGGSSLNYVLAGIIVGLAFSAVQTLMMSLAGHQVTNVLSWLFGSFSNVSWSQVWLIVVPAVSLSLVPLLWAKEFNLVLLGEEQAKQMGLNVRMFNRSMLILASILTSVCVAFVGIIGFVGLVIPHLCRMLLGGDHRMVLPSSIVLGGILMMLADFSSRMLFFGQELPVGAITTIIGVPVFAYLLINRGRMYDG